MNNLNQIKVQKLYNSLSFQFQRFESITHSKQSKRYLLDWFFYWALLTKEQSENFTVDLEGNSLILFNEAVDQIETCIDLIETRPNDLFVYLEIQQIMSRKVSLD